MSRRTDIEPRDGRERDGWRLWLESSEQRRLLSRSALFGLIDCLFLYIPHVIFVLTPDVRWDPVLSLQKPGICVLVMLVDVLNKNQRLRILCVVAYLATYFVRSSWHGQGPKDV